MSRYKRQVNIEPPKWLSPAALYEMFERHSQCILVPRGKCPLLVFTTQLAEEINAYFNSDDENG